MVPINKQCLEDLFLFELSSQTVVFRVPFPILFKTKQNLLKCLVVVIAIISVCKFCGILDHCAVWFCPKASRPLFAVEGKCSVFW